MVKKEKTQKRGRALDPDARQKQLIDLAYGVAEQQLVDGTASASVITHFLKLGSERESLERSILEKQAELITAKADSITQQRENEDLTRRAIEAMKSYSTTSDNHV